MEASRVSLNLTKTALYYLVITLSIDTEIIYVALQNICFDTLGY